MSAPDFAQLSVIDEQLLKAKLDAVRLSISHPGEKGRELEDQVRRLLREILPPEYGLTTGFVAWIPAKGELQLSTQLDIIIYDAIKHSPLIHLASCDVLPLEAVYAYVEVKASLCSASDHAKELPHNSIEACVEKNAPLRAMNKRVFRSGQGSPVEIVEHEEPWLSMRAYVIAFEASGSIAGNPDYLASRMAQVLKKNGHAHLHGVLIPGHGFFYTRPVDANKANADDFFHVRYTLDHPLLAFKSVLLEGLATFQRPEGYWTAAIDRYFLHAPLWHEKAPTSE